jgi:hypothetical protein
MVGEVRGSNLAASIIVLYDQTSQTRGATWQPLIGPRGTLQFAPKMPRVQILLVQMSTNQRFPCQQGCHISCHGCTIIPCHCHVWVIWTVWTGTVSIIFFTCLARQTDRDNFSIRTPFAKINIPSESGERDGRNGTIFVAF